MARTADPAVRTALIETSARLLAEDGLDALSIRRVAREVGTSTTAVYTHFGSKDELVAEVVREAFARLAAELAAVPRTDDPIADLRGAGEAYRRNALANADLYRVMFDRNPTALGDPTTRVDPTVGLDAFGALSEAVERCVEAGMVDGDPAALALRVWAAAHGAVSLELAGFLGDGGHTVFSATAAAVLDGLRS
ncbi:TetR/AcrR family transcriptional regulator [soil metagenome]